MLRRVGVRAAAAAFASLAAGTAAAEAGMNSHGDARRRKSPFSYRELDDAIVRRKEQEKRLATYVATVSPMLNKIRSEMARAHALGDEIAVEQAKQSFNTLATRAQAETASLTWGSSENEMIRKSFVEQFGCVRWTDSAIAEILKHSPLIEIGAGMGQWQRVLCAEGADIVAYDDHSTVPGGGNDEIGRKSKKSNYNGTVKTGNEKILQRKWVKQQNRTLLIVYPEGDLLHKCLWNYVGDVVLFVGEGRGGVNCSSEFVFDWIEREFLIEKIIKVKPFGDGHERLWVLRRKRKVIGK
ncbi:hypothetical protein N8152_02930 [bacterium]|nr:hypothetical protein [bacterium]